MRSYAFSMDIAASLSNSWFNTLHGIDVAGRRLAEEVILKAESYSDSRA